MSYNSGGLSRKAGTSVVWAEEEEGFGGTGAGGNGRSDRADLRGVTKERQ